MRVSCKRSRCMAPDGEGLMRSSEFVNFLAVFDGNSV